MNNSIINKLNNPEFIHSASVNEFLPPLSNWTTIGGVALLAIFGTALTLSGILKYQVTVKASATIRPTGELRLVQVGTDGSIKKVLVQVNQVVKKGDVIAYMNNSRDQTKKRQLQTNIEQAKLQLIQIDAQVLAIEKQIESESDRNDRVIASAQAELKLNQRDLQDKQITSLSQVEEAEANLKQAQQELGKNQIHIKTLQANLESSQAAFAAAQAKLDRYKPLAKSGSISIDQFQEVELTAKQLEQQVKSQIAAIEEHFAAIQQQKQAVSAAMAKRKAALTVLNPSHANVKIAQEKIAVETATGKSSLSKLSQEREQLLTQKLETNKQISRDRQELQQVMREISGSIIRASASGIIQELNLRNSSQVVHSGDVVAQIIPSNTSMTIKALVSPEDIRKVQKGQLVQMRVSSCSYTDYGTLKGRVKAISPDTIKPTSKDGVGGGERTGNSGAYDVEIQPSSLILRTKNKSCAIQSGMDGRVDIISSQETVLHFLLRKARLMTDL